MVHHIFFRVRRSAADTVARVGRMHPATAAVFAVAVGILGCIAYATGDAAAALVLGQ